jgi:outer membrane protein assembly factor BamE (lipoprotein component of BamABCDE complex)
MMQSRYHVLAALCIAICAGGCTTAATQPGQPGSAAERQMTLGVVQKEIRAGLTQDEVVAALGSPNIVTRDAQGRETWIYDKIASEASYSTKGAYGTVLLVGASTASGVSSQSERTLTVTIKYGPDQRVDTFSYHSSRF